MEAANADDALVTLQAENEIDVVITDVQMPGKIDGLTLVGIVASRYPHIQSLVSSGALV